ncbi:MAG: YhgE/Pip domain-containing protein [Collinsella sp.]
MSLASKLSNAKVSFAIFKRDIKRLLMNPVALVVTLGVCVIPSLYAWYNIVANWDPYGNTRALKSPSPTTIRAPRTTWWASSTQAIRWSIGSRRTTSLAGPSSIGGRCQEGVESGEYYAAIVIPKNFSDNLVSMLDGNYHQPKLTYYVNEKKSAIAPKVTDTGASTIEEQINSEFVSTVGETVASIAKDAGVDLKDKATQTQDSLASSVSEASDTLGEVRDSIGDMNAAIDKTSGAIASAMRHLPACRVRRRH